MRPDQHSKNTFSRLQGASLGLIFGSVFALWVGFGSYSIDRHISTLPTDTANCSISEMYYNSTVEWSTTTASLINTTSHIEEKHQL